MTQWLGGGVVEIKMEDERMKNGGEREGGQGERRGGGEGRGKEGYGGKMDERKERNGMGGGSVADPDPVGSEPFWSDSDPTIKSHKTRKKPCKLNIYILYYIFINHNQPILNKKYKIVNKTKQSEF